MNRTGHKMKRLSNLRKLVADDFADMGWTLDGTRFVPPDRRSKDDIRLSHRAQRLDGANGKLQIIRKHGKALLQEFADGAEVNPENFDPVLISVSADSYESRLFRFASLLWTIPIKEGYGRR